jgi:hypothetical protein
MLDLGDKDPAKILGKGFILDSLFEKDKILDFSVLRSGKFSESM